MNVAELFVTALEREGVEYVFGLPGDENLVFMEAIRQSSINFVLVRHEQAAGFMAAAYGLVTGKLAVAMATLGAGAMNTTTAVAQAYLGGMPMIVVTGQKDVRDNHMGRYQLVDVVAVMKPITKFSASVGSAETMAQIAHEAIHQARSPRPGPVHIELPNDIARDEIPSDGHYHGLLPQNSPDPSVASSASLATAAQLIEKAIRPLILIGGNANNPAASAALTAFVKKSNIPFFVTMLGKGVVDERLPQYIGTAAMPANDYVHCAINTSDLVINVGHDIMEKPPFIMMEGDGRTVIHINPSAAEAHAVYFPQHQVVGNIVDSLNHLTRNITPSAEWNFENAMKARTAQLKSIANNSTDSKSFPVKPQYLATVVREFMGEDDIVSVDNGIHKLWFSRNYPAYTPHSLIIDNALGSMGPALPAATALKLAYPDRTVLALAGDGGFMMNVQELETAVRLGIDLIVVIMNDNGLGMIRLKQMRDGYGELGVNFNNPDFAKLADSFGATGHRVVDSAEIPNILAQAKASGGVHVIEVPVDYSENMMLFKEMKMIDCSRFILE